LDNCRSTQIEGLTDDFASLEILSLINVGLTTLKGFPNLPNLRKVGNSSTFLHMALLTFFFKFKLELSDNRISNGLNNLLGCTQLTHLNLSGNKVKDMEVVGPLVSTKNHKYSNHIQIYADFNF
jgi:acidic leucine-rich nuclear phosphoprotein 32 family protein A/C/D